MMSSNIPFSLNFVYSVAGLRLLTNRRIPELNESGYTDGTVSVFFNDNERAMTCASEVLTDPKCPGQWHRLPDEMGPPACVRDDGKVALVSESDSSSQDYAVMLRRVVPFASVLQGKIILHASAIRSGETVLAFIGASGAGKSTLINQLNALGFPVISDDLLPCRTWDGKIMAPFTQKESVKLGRFPLTRIYFLYRKRGLDQPRCIQITKKQCVQELISNGFGELPVEKAWAVQFFLYHQIAEQALAFRLCLPDDFTKVHESAISLANNFFPAHRCPIRTYANVSSKARKVA